MSNFLDQLEIKTDKYRSLPFWSWNDKLEIPTLLEQIDWMHANGIGGFFMHARSGLRTEYLSEEWMQCVDACIEHAKKLGMDPWIYDENGWPSGFVGGKLLENKENQDRYLTYSLGAFEDHSLVSYLIDGERLVRTDVGGEGMFLNIFEHYSGATADILNPDVVDQFISLTHEAYRARYGSEFSEKLHGFFTDEPQYFRWHMPYTVMIRKYFTEELGEDILDGLGLLFVKKEGYRKFRYNYFKGMQKLMLRNFAKKIFDWCEKNGVKLTGHYLEEATLGFQVACCGGIMPFYEYEHIPGIDWLGRYCDSPLAARQVLSVAKQLGREQVLCEMYACAGWDISPLELKVLTEYVYINGVNLTCHHLVPYSERGNRLHDHPAHYSPDTPWVNDSFKDFNDYFTNLGALLGNSEENVKVAVLQTVRSAYFDFDHDVGEGGGHGVSHISAKLIELVKKLEDEGVAYHLVDETLLEKYGDVKDGKLYCGKCGYEYLVIPYCITMDASTEALIKRFTENGGKVLLVDGRPTHLEWNEYPYDYLESNVTFDDIFALKPYGFKAKGGDIHVTLRHHEKGEFLFVANNSLSEAGTVSFDLGGSFASLQRVDLLSDERKTYPLSFTLAKGESGVFIPSADIVAEQEDKEELVLDGEYDIKTFDNNYMLLDTLQYSFDGKTYGESICVPLVFRNLLEKRYAGPLYLKYNFEIESVPQKIGFSLEWNRVKGISVNGKQVTDCSDITSALCVGKNNIVVELDYFQNENVYIALFGSGDTESLKNCIVYDTELEPIYLKGIFGVYEKNGFTVGDAPNVRIGHSFRIGHTPKTLCSLTADGLPFFAGSITLSKKVTLENTNMVLRLSGRWHLAKVTVNGTYLGKLMYSDTVDISTAAVKGENEIIIEYTFSNRNLYGPHHYIDEEPTFVGPSMFEFTDSNGKNVFRDRYSLIELLNP